MISASFMGWAAGICTLFAYFPYIISILRNKTKPNRATWLVLSVVGIMLASSYYNLGSGLAIWAPLGDVIGPLIIAILSFWYGQGSWTKLDRNCIVIALISALLWLIFNAPIMTLIINLIMDFSGLLPTARKTYFFPASEDFLAWFLWWLGSFFNIYAISAWTLSDALYPVYMFVGNSILLGLLIAGLFKMKIRVN